MVPVYVGSAAVIVWPACLTVWPIEPELPLWLLFCRRLLLSEELRLEPRSMQERKSPQPASTHRHSQVYQHECTYTSV